MNGETSTSASSKYEIRFEPCTKRVRVEFNGTWVADSTRAIVVHETRLAPAYYFPKEDVRTDLLEKTDHRTHCPYRGNASYWTLRVGVETRENAAWCYEDPYPDGEPVGGLFSFYQSKISAIYEGDEEIPFLRETLGSMHANPIAGWLVRDAWKAGSPDALVKQFCQYVRRVGVPIARMTVIIPTLHPQIFATVLVWRENESEVKTISEPHDILHRGKFAKSPFAPIIRGAGGVRRRLEGDDPKLDFPVLHDLHAEGATDYVAMPFRFTDGQINVLSMTSFTAGGFTTAQLGQLYEVLPMLGRLFEVFAQRRIAVGLLETYLGRSTGQRVLNGQVKHGDGENIHAVIWFSDLRNSTGLSESMDRETYLLYLNRFLYCVAGAVLECGGEVLSFIGDAMLAIFPIAESAGETRAGATGTLEACRRATTAARMVEQRVDTTNDTYPDMPPIRYGIGLHLGDLTYGNIGVPERLEFTVIGPAANEAARIESMTKQLKEKVLISSVVADQIPGKVISKGRHALRGVGVEHELFTLPAE